ncbi:hypothetical protein DPMN_112962 [Dreissena polymorpha]|uniref:L-Fucosyltransferase n=1 Tax=Dreissena polymorpha TaxID=45954 RepID=A0A9D4KHA7_DREPO|nr:hypothetical protein DPMN_112962 [Dreissena polymorpha]
MVFVIVQIFAYRHFKLNTVAANVLHGGKEDIVTTRNSSSQSSDMSNNRNNGTLSLESKRQQSNLSRVVSDFLLGEKQDFVSTRNSSAEILDVSNNRHNETLKRQQSNLNTVVPNILPGGKEDIATISNYFAQSSLISKIIHNGTFSLRLIGRLGNQMFQYDSILGLADMMNFTHIVFDGGNDLRSSFQLSDNRVKFTRISTKGRIIGEHVCCAFDKRLTKFKNTEDVHVNGYLVSWMYFHNIDKHIRKNLHFRPASRQRQRA